MEAKVLSCCFSWVWSCMPKVLWNNKSPISLERVEWFCRFFASSFLHLVRYTLKLHKYAILGWHYQTDSQPIRLSDVLNLKNLKTIWVIKLIFCFHGSYRKYHAFLGYDLKILLASQFAGFLTLDLFDMLIFIPRVYCYVVLVLGWGCLVVIYRVLYSWHLIYFSFTWEQLELFSVCNAYLHE